MRVGPTSGCHSAISDRSATREVEFMNIYHKQGSTCMHLLVGMQACTFVLGCAAPHTLLLLAAAASFTMGMLIAQGWASFHCGLSVG